MDLNFIVEMYIPLVLAACLCIGFALSYLVPMDNKWIPTIMLILGVIFGCIVNKNFEFATMVAGGVTGLASTGLHQVFKQLIGSKNYNNEDDTKGLNEEGDK